MIVRAATIEDSRRIWAWRNDPVSRANFRNISLVSWSEHEVWFANALASLDVVLLVGMVDNDPFGVVRFNCVDVNEFEVSINIDPDRRGRGLGRRLLWIGCEVFKLQRPFSALTAQIKVENTRSQKSFEACQFVRTGIDDTFVAYRWIP